MKRLGIYMTAMLLVGVSAVAAPVIDGVMNDAEYVSIGTYTQGDGFGPHGLVELFAFSDLDNLYLGLVGEGETGTFNPLVIFVNSANEPAGVPAGTPLPAGSDGFSPFSGIGGTVLDMQADIGVRVSAGNSPEAFASIVDYRDAATTDTFLATLNTSGAAADITSGPWNGVTLAYLDAATRTDAATAQSGLEISIPLDLIGSRPGDYHQFLAAYTSGGGFWSSDTIPEISGNGSNNLGDDPDFSGIAGTQASPGLIVPVELSGFDVE